MSPRFTATTLIHKHSLYNCTFSKQQETQIITLHLSVESNSAIHIRITNVCVLWITIVHKFMVTLYNNNLPLLSVKPKRCTTYAFIGQRNGRDFPIGCKKQLRYGWRTPFAPSTKQVEILCITSPVVFTKPRHILPIQNKCTVHAF